MSNATIWAPGLIWSTNTLYAPILSAAVGMTGLALLSKLPDLIPQYIFMIKPSPFGQAIGQNMDMSKAGALVSATATQGAHNMANSRFRTQEALVPGSADARARAGKFVADIMELSGKAKSNG